MARRAGPARAMARAGCHPCQRRQRNGKRRRPGRPVARQDQQPRRAEAGWSARELPRASFRGPWPSRPSRPHGSSARTSPRPSPGWRAPAPGWCDPATPRSSSCAPSSTVPAWLSPILVWQGATHPLPWDQTRSIRECNQLNKQIISFYSQHLDGHHSAMKGMSGRAHAAHSGPRRHPLAKFGKPARLPP